VSIEIEPPFKLGQRPTPTEPEAYRADLLERRRWNDGGLGRTLRDPPPPEGHPEPRVIVNIVKVSGPHRAKSLQRLARRNHWMPIIRCYRLGAWLDPHLRGWTRAQIGVTAAGGVRRPRLIRTELGDRAVASCMVERLADLELPRARRSSRVIVDMRVGPGDDPMPPPEDQIAPGEGTLPHEAMVAGVRAGLPEIERCYRAAFDYAPELWGRLAIRFHLTEGGRLDEAFEVESRFPDARTKQCILRAARQLRFARPKGGDIRFVVPLRLVSERAPVGNSVVFSLSGAGFRDRLPRLWPLAGGARAALQTDQQRRVRMDGLTDGTG